MSITDLLKNPISEVLGSVGDILGRFIASPDDKLKAQQELAKLSFDFQTKIAEIDVEWAKTQATVVTAEIQSESWAARNWRPILMLSFTYIVVHTYVAAPLFHLTPVNIPPDMWDLLRLGIGGYVIGRSVEKITPSIADAIAAKKQG
jgi:hypothetical protein